MTHSPSAAPSAAVSLPDADWRRVFRRRLLSWYRREARALPWRDTRDPYAIWVSEIMLQQTQVETVKPYYVRFLAELPTIAALAAAEERHVLRLWEGLGYYRRARQLHAAAQRVIQQHQGQMPRDIQQLQALPGIGRYTAGAILSFAFDDPHPILEANTIRLFARLLGYPGDPTRSEGQRLLWSLAESLLPRRNVSQVNQALMELGSLVCVSRQPDCQLCPATGLCAAQRDGTQAVIPNTAKKMRYESVREIAIVIRDRSRVLLRQCQEGERWAGLWDFPRLVAGQEPFVTGKRNRQPESSTQALVEHLRNSLGLDVELEDRLATLRHGVTRYRITLDCYAGRVRPGTSRRTRRGAKWIATSALDEYPLSTTGRKIAALVKPRREAQASEFQVVRARRASDCTF